MKTPTPPWALLRARPPGGSDRVWLAFTRPREVLEAWRHQEVRPLLRAAEAATHTGRWVVGFVAYEAAPAFDTAFVTRPPAALPLAWFALFERPAEWLEPPAAARPCPALEWAPSLSPEDHRRAVERIRGLIAAGDTYQVNFTWRLEAAFSGDPWALFDRLAARAPTEHAAYLDTGRHVLASASPELFFRLERQRLTCRPMKGTSRRGRSAAEDRRRALELFDSPKNRAENLMIVDMIRNDLGRIARAGSVEVESLFDLERHDTVFQMTSTVTARSGATPSEALAALFPCASVTGAPKVRTMEIIAGLEATPRGAYTGALGYLAPGGHAEMAVAIRTAWIDRRAGRARYGTGGGIVWDSEADAEHREGIAKTLVLAGPERGFALLETLMWTEGAGYRRLARHLDRLEASAEYFGIPLARARVEGELRRLAAALRRSGESRRVVRLLAVRDGDLQLESRAPAGPEGPWRLALARRPVDPEDRFLFHKTTRREVYERAREEAPGYNDVLLWNPVGELTESTRANVAVQRGGVWRTPPVACGLLAGCERQALLDTGELVEERLAVADLVAAENIALVNSVRGWITVASVSDPGAGRTLWGPPPSARGRNPGAADS